MRPRRIPQPKSPDGAGESFLWTIALLCVAAVAAAFAGLVGASAHAAGADDVRIEGRVSGPLLPGLTTTVTVTVAAPPSVGRPFVKVRLRGISTDLAHAACPTSVGGAGADFTMPPIRLGPDRAAAGVLTGRTHLTMNATGSDQDACQGARLTLRFAGR